MAKHYTQVRKVTLAGLFGVLFVVCGQALSQGAAPTPLLAKGHPVDWWFVFKLNGSAFPGCGGTGEQRACPFGGTVQKKYGTYGQQFAYASSEDPNLRKGSGCAGDTLSDPLGATFDQVYNGSYFYVIWNDQPYGDPKIPGCSTNCSSPWGHSKGMLSWNDDGAGFVLQVTTPSWPESGSKGAPRQHDGNTLGCVSDNNVKLSQHFFALKLTKDDVISVLKAIQNASVATDPTQEQVVRNGGPQPIQDLVSTLGAKSKHAAYTRAKLSSGVEIISKPSALHVPPWQMVSAVLGGVPLRSATFWASPFIPTTTSSSSISCWDDSLGKPGPVEIATSGAWAGQEFGLNGGSNHAKIGVSTSGSRSYALFSDLNQQGTLSGNCASSQNGRGGLFYVLENKSLTQGISSLIAGKTAPTKVPKR